MYSSVLFFVVHSYWCENKLVIAHLKSNLKPFEIYAQSCSKNCKKFKRETRFKYIREVKKKTVFSSVILHGNNFYYTR